MKCPSDNSCTGKPGGAAADARAEAPQAPGAALGDAEAGNTASHNCIGRQGGEEPSFQVLWQGMDTLELSYQGQISPEADEELKRLKDLAQSAKVRHQVLAQLKLGERIFEVGDRGGGRLFSYLLRHPDMRIAVSSGKAKRIPLASVTFQNQFLVSAGPEGAAAAARSALAELGTLDGHETVSRFDQAADVGTTQDIGAWGEDAWVTRASDIHRHTMDGIFTGWSLGLGAVVSSRLYDKLREINNKSHKTYFFDLWQEAGWFYGDPVKRLEHQFRRGALAQFQLQSVADVLAARPALWDYATKEWTRLTVPNPGDETKARWPLHPFWERIQGIKWEGKIAALSRRRLDGGAPSDRTLARMFKAVVTSVMARDGLQDVGAAAEKLSSILMAQLQRIEEWEGASAYDLIMETVMLKQRKYCSRLNNP